MDKNAPFDPFKDQRDSSGERPWLALLLMIAGLILCFHFYMSPASPIDQIAQQQVGGPTFVHLAGEWFDAEGQAVSLPKQVTGELLALWPLSNDTVIASTEDETLWACNAELTECAPWGDETLHPEAAFQLLPLPEQRVAMLSRDPAWLYLLNKNGQVLDTKLVPDTAASLAWHRGRLYLTQLRQRRIRSIAVEGAQWQDWQTQHSFRNSPIDEHADGPQRLRRVGDEWWLMLRSGSRTAKLYALNEQWQKRALIVERLSTLQDWAPLGGDQLLLLDADHRLWRAEAFGDGLAEIKSPALSQAASADERRLQFFAIGMVVCFIGLIVVIALSHQQRFKPSRILSDLKADTDAGSTPLENNEATGETVWLEPEPAEMKRHWRQQRIERWLTPLSWGLGTAAMAAALWYQWWAVVVVLVIYGITGLLGARVFAPRQRRLYQARLGVRGEQLMLELPGERPEILTPRPLYFDGQHLYCALGQLALFNQQHLIGAQEVAQPRFEKAAFVRWAVPVLEKHAVKPPFRERIQASLRDGTFIQRNSWLLIVVAAIAAAALGL